MLRKKVTPNGALDLPASGKMGMWASRRPRARRRAAERGAVQVEFVAVAFILFLTIFAIVEMERMLLVYTTLANATKAGVRYATVHGSDRTGTGTWNGPSSSGSHANVDAVVAELAKAGLLKTSNLTVTVTYTACTPSTQCPTSNSPGSTVNVTAVYAYDPFTVLPLTVDLHSVSQGIITF